MLNLDTTLATILVLASQAFSLTGAFPASANAPAPILVDIKGSRADVHPIDRYNQHRMTKRASSDTLKVNLRNMYSFYAIDLNIGTPAQNVSFIIDTGSSDLWAMSSDNPYCSDSSSSSSVSSDSQIDCSDASTFDYKKSSTFQVNSSDTTIDFYISYGDGTFAEGIWGTDKIEIGGLKLSNASIAVATRTNSSSNVFGIGLVGNEATENQVIYPSGTTAFPTLPTSQSQVEELDTYTYNNIPLQLYESGAIGSYAYSLWLNDLYSSSGNILFGGVDHAKYTGSLTTIPIIGDSTFTVELTSVTLSNGNGDSATLTSGVEEALLDSGTTITYLSESTFSSLVNGLGFEYEQSIESYYGLCSVASNSDAALIYDFSGAKITVNLTELVVPLTTDQGETLQDKKGRDLCVLLAAYSDQTILGDTFLRSAYVVYDLKNMEISIANTNFNATDSNIEAIVSTVPSATAATATSAITGTLGSGITGALSFGVATGLPDVTGTADFTGTAASATGSSSSDSTATKSGKNAAGMLIPTVSTSMLAFLVGVVGVLFI